MSYSLVINNQPVTAFNLTGGQTKRVMGENVVDISFAATSYLEIPFGTILTVYGEDYRLNKPATWKKISDRHYEYSLHLESISYDLINYQYFFYNNVNQPTETQFSLMANAEGFIDLLIKNANRVGHGWTKGVIDPTEYKNLTFNQENCLQVLTRLVQEYDTEFWIDGKTINLTKRTFVSGVKLSYGRGHGLYDISRSNKDENVVTRLYAYGGNKNIPSNYRGFSSRLKMPVTTGAYIEQNVSEYGIIEHSIVFDDIYPHREGVISAVNPADPLAFTDSALDFDVNAQLLPGIAAKVVFNTGQLAGYEFEISSYDAATKTFVLIVNKDEKALEIPSTVFKPAVGDKYVLVDLLMPQAYIDAAEIELQVRATEYLTKNSKPRVVYSVTTDAFHFDRTNTFLDLGSTVNISDTATGVNENPRIIAYTRDINNGHLYTSLELSETVQISPIVKQFSQQEKIERALIINNLFDPNTPRRRQINVQELMNMVFDPETGNYYSDKITPLSIDTTMIAIGARSQIFELNGTIFEPNYTGNPAKIRVSAGTLDHFSVNPDTIVTWQLSAYVNDNLAPESAYYIYAKCEKGGSNGTFLFTTAKIKVDQDSEFYHFLVGVLHTPVNNVRGISLTYGQSTINGRFITTGKVQSADGLTYFDLDNGQIAGKIMFTPAGGGALVNVADVHTTANSAQSAATQAATTASNAQAAANVAVSNAADARSAADLAAQEAAAADLAAQNAQVTANTANNLLADLANDNKLTPVEKQETKKQWNIIAGERPTIIAQATTYGLSSTAYDTAYNALNSYLSSLLADLSVTSDIDGPTFRSQFASYFDQKTLLLKQISDAAKAAANTAQNAANVAQSAANDAQSAAAAAQLTANEAKGVTDNFTVIDGGVIMSNTIKLGSLAQDVAGITGVGSLPESIRFWAGASYANRGTAPFRVDQAGNVYAVNATISGHITATSGSIGGVTTINAGNNFSLNGSKVVIIPDQGISSTGYLRIPLQAPANPQPGDIWISDGATAGDPGGGGSGGATSMIELSDTNIVSPAHDQLLKYNSSNGKWENWTPTFTTDLSNYWTKAEADARFLAIGGTAQNAVNWSGYDGAAVASPTYLMSYNGSTGKFGVSTPAQVKTFLGLASETLATVTGRGSSTSTMVTFNGGVTVPTWIYQSGLNGLYNTSYSGHFYQSSSSFWTITGGNVQTMGLKFSATHESGAYGYVYNDASGFGLLNGGSWSVRTYAGGGELTGNWNATGYLSASTVYSRSNIYTNANYGYGLVGLYESTRYQGVFAMGEAYKLPADGLTPGNLYGITWTHSNVGGQSISNLGHQALFMANGQTMTAIGDGVWTRSTITAAGNIYSNGVQVVYNSGTWNINVSGNAGSSNLLNPLVGDSNYKLGYTANGSRTNAGEWGRAVMYYVPNGQTYGIRVDRSDYSDNSNLLDGYDYSNFIGYNGNTYYQVNNWLQLNGAFGLYAPSYFGCHLYPNTTSTYTQWQISGVKNGYGGIYDNVSGVNGIMYDSAGNGGVYREASGRWYWYHNVNDGCTAIGTSQTFAGYTAATASFKVTNQLTIPIGAPASPEPGSIWIA